MYLGLLEWRHSRISLELGVSSGNKSCVAGVEGVSKDDRDFLPYIELICLTLEEPRVAAS